MCKWNLHWISLFAGMVFLAVPAGLCEENAPVTFDFNDVEIRSFIKIVSELTGENYVIDPAVTGKITITSPQAIPRENVPSVFEAVLDTYGYAAVPDGEIVKIVPVARAKQETIQIGEGTGGSSEGLITKIIHLKKASSAEVSSIISPLLSRAGHLTSHAPSNTLILTDHSRNMDRLERIIRVVDESGSDLSVQTVKLNYAQADGIAESLNLLYGSKSVNIDPKPFFVAESRSNILLVASPQQWAAEILSLVAKLDEPLPENSSRIRVIRLKNADAASIAEILNRQINQLIDPSQQAERKETRSESESGLLVGADPASNALIVAATPKDLEVIENVVRELDVPRQQIWVEALIVEISSGRTRELGVEWRLTDELSEDEYRGFGGTNLPVDGSSGTMQQTAKDPLNTASGLVLGIVKGTVSFGGVELANIAALARAMESESGVNVLSTPHLLTLDNEEAEIIVGEERPYLKNSQTMENGAVVRTFEFKDIGLTLRLTPRLTEDGQIVMKVFQEIKNFVAETDLGAVTSTKRQAKTTIRVADGQMVAIGGLLKEDTTGKQSRVPCLGSIPVISYLFQSEKKSKTKTNLVIFITPHIVKSTGDLDALSKDLKTKAEDGQPSTPGTAK